MATISNILEHWASIYKPLCHNPESNKLEERRFFRIRYIDLENIFQRNANVMHDLVMLYSVASTGHFKAARQAEVSHQIWFLAKIKDSPQTLGFFDGRKQEMAARRLEDVVFDFVSYLMEVRKGVCPITKRSFMNDPQLVQELQAVNVESISFGIMPQIIQNSYLCAGVDWDALKPIYAFHCGSNGKYITPEENL